MIIKINILLMSSFLFATAPDWEYTPGDYEFTSWILGGAILSNGDNISEEDDMFAAFDQDDNVRGVASQVEGFGPTSGQIMYEMTIGSNANGDIISFKYYNASEDAILNITETYEFTTNEQQGNLVDPVLYNMYSTSLSFSNVTTASIDINYVSDVDIAGFQFLVTGVNLIIGLSDLGGASIGSNGMVLAFSMSGASLPAGSGTLISLEFIEDEGAILEVSDVLLSGTDGSAISSSGPGSIEIQSVPFSYNHATQQAFYFFQSVTINGVAVNSDDWVGAFNGNVCVGARQWDTSQCGGGVCDLPAMGDSGDDISEGYMTLGDIPSFKIYDASENAYYDAVASDENIPWSNMGIYNIDLLSTDVSILGCIDDGSFNDSPYPDIAACNYDNTATEDDNSCYYSCIGCKDGAACNYDSNFTVACNDCCEYPEEYYDCSGTYCQGEGEELDCAGECNGEAELSSCGCDEPAPDENQCCANGLSTTGEAKDCSGECGGDAIYDNCGYLCVVNTPSDDCSIYCDDDPSNDCVKDCTGTWGGTAEFDCAGACEGTTVLDECGVCGGDNAPNTGNCDCTGVPNGGSTEDNCGTCDDNSSNDCTQDCKGNWCIEGTADCLVGVGSICTSNDLPGCDVCDICGGSYTDQSDCTCAGGEEMDCGGYCSDNDLYDVLENDECGVCSNNEHPDWNSTCADCGGVPNGGSTEDNCGTCDSDPSNDCELDCVGVWGGSIIDDECGICGGNNTSCSDCAGIPNGDAAYDICGLLCLQNTPTANCSEHCDDNPSNDCVQDCYNVFGGTAESDCTGECEGTALVDECGVCEGDGPEEHYDCEGNCVGVLDCEYTCGGSVLPEIECTDASGGVFYVCEENGCELDIQLHLLPDKFGINKIFPNPFNPITQIQYEISGYAFVKVRIFDIRGREVAQLMNEYQNPGQYHINWDAGNHASGMYIVEMVIRSGDDTAIFRDVRKILYMK